MAFQSSAIFWRTVPGLFKFAYWTQITLNNGRIMPSIGFGTAGLGSGTTQAVHQALLADYTLIDTAQASISF